MISLAGISKSYDGRVVLAPTSLEIGAAERLAVVGPSGCGKSTLLRSIVGIVVPDRGTVTVAGTTLTPATAPALRLRMGYVIQEGGLFPHLTCAENISLVARLRGWASAKIDARLGEMARLVRLDRDMLARYPLQLSGGERQRVGLIRALMLDPDVLLLDEPMGALDPMVRARLQDELLAIVNDLGKSVVLVTHDMYEAALLGHAIAVMRAGEILQRGTLRELIESPADPFVGEFIRAQRAMGPLG